MGGIERVVFNLVLTKLGFWELQRERERERERERGADWEFKKFRRPFSRSHLNILEF